MLRIRNVLLEMLGPDRREAFSILMNEIIAGTGMRSAPLFDLNRLAIVAAESYSDLRWRLHPSCALLTSAYPVAAIWQAHQDGSPADFHIDLNSGGDSLLVYRNGLSVEILGIAPASRHWLAQLQQGAAMGAATDATLSNYPDFDLATTLRHWLAQGVLRDFDITQGEQR